MVVKPPSRTVFLPPVRGVGPGGVNWGAENKDSPLLILLLVNTAVVLIQSQKNVVNG